MNVKLVPGSREDKTLIQHLMQLYIYDFSEYIGYDVEADGLFAAYPSLDEYWEQKDQRFSYIIEKDGKHAGFVLVKFTETTERNYFSIAEFFVMKKYRRTGIGSSVATQVFGLHKGQWQVHQEEANKPAQMFWAKVIDKYTKGKFTQSSADGKMIQDFEN